MRTKTGKFKTPYTNKLIISYLKAVSKLIDKSPTFRDVHLIPGPSPRTIVRHFGTWSKALKSAGIRPQTNQLMIGEKSFIRKNWRKMTDKQLGKRLGISPEVVKYYRIQYNLWKNRKGTSNQKHKADGMRMYGKNCEICNLPITELHHIKPNSTSIRDWSILCPNCHAVITRHLIEVKNRKELKTKLTPFIRNIYKNIKFNLEEVAGNDNASI
ncbi:MAG: hypothetical protein NTZ07_01605 [Candidatus Woesebacteria bacterium]|nr:hypothetical protein [Candidatus Woesebacteria bacterium]